MSSLPGSKRTGGAVAKRLLKTGTPHHHGASSRKKSTTNHRKVSKASGQPSIPAKSPKSSCVADLLREDEDFQSIVEEMISRLQASEADHKEKDGKGEITCKVDPGSSEIEGEPSCQSEATTSASDRETMKKVCAILSEQAANSGDKKSFRDVVSNEINRPKSEFEMMLNQSQLVTAWGRRIFDAEDMGDEDQEEEEKIEEPKKKIVSKYMKIFQKEEDEVDEREQELIKSGKEDELNAIKENPVEFGLWDQALDPVSVISTLDKKVAKVPLKLRQESEFEKQVRLAQQEAKEREEREQREATTTKVVDKADDANALLNVHQGTGKYLHEADMKWCQKNTKMGQSAIIKWFKRYRQLSPRGRMSKKELLDAYRHCYKGDSGLHFVNEMFRIYSEDHPNGFLDFKDFLIIMEVTTCASVSDKMRWMSRLLDMGATGHISIGEAKIAPALLDTLQTQVPEEYYDNPEDYEVSKIAGGAASAVPRLERSVEQRIKMLEDYVETDSARNITVETFSNIPGRIVSARDF